MSPVAVTIERELSFEPGSPIWTVADHVYGEVDGIAPREPARGSFGL